MEIEKTKKKRLFDQTSLARLAAKKMGKLGGRPKKLNGDKIKKAIDLYTRTNKPIIQICKELEISRPTYYAFLKEKGLK